MKRVFALLVMWLTPAQGQSDPWKALTFLEGTWEAKTQAQGTSAASAEGTYTFAKELSGHILARHSTTGGCKGPDVFDCQHGDLLYVYREGTGQPLRAIYFDNEGHVIHYSVSIPTPDSALFLSDTSTPGPQFRLMYERKGATMSGRFQMRMPGKADWMSYLEWSGARK